MTFLHTAGTETPHHTILHKILLWCSNIHYSNWPEQMSKQEFQSISIWNRKCLHNLPEMLKLLLLIGVCCKTQTEVKTSCSIGSSVYGMLEFNIQNWITEVYTDINNKHKYSITFIVCCCYSNWKFFNGICRPQWHLIYIMSWTSGQQNTFV